MIYAAIQNVMCFKLRTMTKKIPFELIQLWYTRNKTKDLNDQNKQKKSRPTIEFKLENESRKCENYFKLENFFFKN